jgi:signal transduction histidine kinase
MTLITLQSWINNLHTKFQTERGQLRVGQREIRKLIRTHEKELTALKEYIHAVGTLDAENVNASLLGKGYLVLLQKELEESFDVLNEIFLIYRKELNKELLDIKDPIDRLPDMVKDDVKRIVQARYNESLEFAEKSLTKLIGDLGGIESINLHAAQFLESESLLRNIYADFRVRDRGSLRTWIALRRKVRSTYAKLDVKNPQKETPLITELFGSESGSDKGKFSKVIDDLLNDYLATAEDCVQYIRKLMKELGDFERKDEGSKVSLATLERPVDKGGRGFPKNYGALVEKEVKRVHDLFKSKVNEIIGLDRMMIADIKHQEA